MVLPADDYQIARFLIEGSLGLIYRRLEADRPSLRLIPAIWLP